MSVDNKTVVCVLIQTWGVLGQILKSQDLLVSGGANGKPF